MDNLLPCPFCGWTALYDKHGNNATGGELHWVKCGNCHARGPSLETWDGAVECWNERHSFSASGGSDHIDIDVPGGLDHR